jgi:predicted lysophospholipase L1 biosynthesis ABC-type transport system permease subunit
MSGVTGSFFPALGIPLRAGRFLTTDDTTRGDRVCVIDEYMARRYWGDGSPLGGQLINGAPDDKEKPFTIVGVVGTVKQNDLAEPGAAGAVYLPFGLFSSRQVVVAVRTLQLAEAFGPALRSAVLRVDPNLPLSDLKTLAGRIDESLVNRRSPLYLAGIFAAVALVLAGIGLYGVLAYAVAQRRREIGVRMALGAQPEQIRAQFLSLGTRLVLLGAAFGGLGAWLSGRAMSGFLFGVGAVHLGIWSLATVVLMAIAMLACLIPAVRAARVPPMEALRSD